MLSTHFATGLSGWLDYEILSIEPARAEARLELRDELLMRSGDYLHAGTVVAFADSVAGYGTLASLPERARGFTTAELKVNLVATTGAGDALLAVATLVHGGRTTQVWDVVVSREHDEPAHRPLPRHPVPARRRAMIIGHRAERRRRRARNVHRHCRPPMAARAPRRAGVLRARRRRQARERQRGTSANPCAECAESGMTGFYTDLTSSLTLAL